MNGERKDQIERRGKILGQLCGETLRKDPTCEIATSGFRWSFLLYEAPKRYAQAFGASDLRISETDLQQAFSDFSAYLPDCGYITWDELEILRHHNAECEKWQNLYKEPVIDFHPRAWAYA